ncbi:hypothetical protein SBA3_430026 [Candidatus Sulfopaludibacter sp. SbA3]|nr:hypothetical protein SBA3_430026 [Candidatus Sulfopaludibacter sp. SbA3]
MPETLRGRRSLTIIDSYKRECLAVETDSCLAARQAAGDSVRQRPESTSRHYLAWREDAQLSRYTFNRAADAERLHREYA